MTDTAQEPETVALDEAAAHIAKLVSGYAWEGLRKDGRARDGGFGPWDNRSGITTNARQEDYRDVVRHVLHLCRPVSLDREAIRSAGYEYDEGDDSVRIRIDAIIALIEGRT